MDTLGLGYIKQGHHADAVKLLEQALKKDPGNKTLLKRVQQARKGITTRIAHKQGFLSVTASSEQQRIKEITE